MVSLEGVQETHLRMTYRCVHQLVYPRKGERIFQTGFVQVCEVYAYPPFGIKYFLDSPCSLKFSYLVLNRFIMVFG